jgi:hypothetical protein
MADTSMGSKPSVAALLCQFLAEAQFMTRSKICSPPSSNTFFEKGISQACASVDANNHIYYKVISSKILHSAKQMQISIKTTEIR